VYTETVNLLQWQMRLKFFRGESVQKKGDIWVSQTKPALRGREQFCSAFSHVPDVVQDLAEADYTHDKQAIANARYPIVLIVDC
jgi:hypothetical protein